MEIEVDEDDILLEAHSLIAIGGDFRLKGNLPVSYPSRGKAEVASKRAIEGVGGGRDEG